MISGGGGTTIDAQSEHPSSPEDQRSSAVHLQGIRKTHGEVVASRRSRWMSCRALSFDELVVTTFTAGAQSTLPIWIFGNIRLGQQLPQVTVVVLFVIVLSVIPVALAQRLTRDTGVMRRAARPVTAGS
jgi:hypothetical protein